LVSREAAFSFDAAAAALVVCAAATQAAGADSDKAPTNKICRRASSEQRPRTRSCYKSERLVRPFLGQTYLLESLFSDPVREQLGISASGDRTILCRV